MVAPELQNKGYRISHVTVAKYMKEMGLRMKLAKKFKVTTDSKHNYLIMDNILNREFEQEEPSKAWVSDITYIPVKEGFLYLTTIIDLYYRKLIRWSLGNNMSTQNTTLPAWRMALKNRDIGKGLIFHSDQGVQYANNMFANTLDFYNVVRSMSRTSNCWDNAVAESFFKSINAEVFEYSEIWYNKKEDTLT